jgi:hypothetical protein
MSAIRTLLLWILGDLRRFLTGWTGNVSPGNRLVRAYISGDESKISPKSALVGSELTDLLIPELDSQPSGSGEQPSI